MGRDPFQSESLRAAFGFVVLGPLFLDQIVFGFCLLGFYFVGLWFVVGWFGLLFMVGCKTSSCLFVSSFFAGCKKLSVFVTKGCEVGEAFVLCPRPATQPHQAKWGRERVRIPMDSWAD